MSDTITLDRPDTDTITAAPPQTQPGEPGDHDRFAHYVEAGALPEAIVNGTPLVALCGKVWVPNADPSKFAVCPECKDAYEAYDDDTEGQE